MPSALKDYIAKGRNKVQGWFSRVDAEIFHSICEYQKANGLDGAVAEIGLHHGKSFIGLCLSLQGQQRAYGIDLFDKQHLNIDSSGRGNRSILERNLTRVGVDLSSVVLDSRPSSEVCANDILKSVGEVRFFSIDGGHLCDVVRNDLVLAETTLCKHGVAALDDFLRPEWPEVSAGYFDWAGQTRSRIVPFALGFNKLYLCREPYADAYIGVLERSELLRLFIAKYCNFLGRQIPVYQTLQLPEWGWRRRAREHVKLYHPATYVRLRALLAVFR